MKKHELSPFQLARYKLTAWYLVMFVSLIVVFTYLTLDAKTSAYVRVYQVVKSGAPAGSAQVQEFSDRFQEFNQRFKERLLVFDVALVAISGYLSYFLSGKTLQPIRMMVEEQQAFASDVSHSLRTPLTTINLELEAYQRSGKQLPAALKQLLTSIQEEVFSMTQLVSGMLVLVRSGTDAYKTKFTEVKLPELLENVVEKMRPLAAAKQQHIICASMDQVTVTGNAESLRQIMYILLDNAVKYSGLKSTISVSIQTQRSLVRLSVQDTGRGIPRKDLPHIFNRFYRADKKTKGTGLGLAIAAKLIAQHDGRIKVKSRLGEGTQFIVQLPRHS